MPLVHPATVRRSLVVACSVAACASLAGCGGPDSMPPQSPTEQASPTLGALATGERGVPLYSYCEPDAAIAAYPHFGASVPPVVARLYPNGGGRDYPVIDVHTHLASTPEEELQIQRDAGVYASVEASWDKGSTPKLRAMYPAPNLIQFNLGDYLIDFEPGKMPLILWALDAQRDAGAGGIKLFKMFGLEYNDVTGARLRIDDPRLYPLWDKAAELGWAVSSHTSDTNSWLADKYPDSPYSKQDLVRQFIRVVEDHPKTVFVAIHMLNLVDSEAELDQLGTYLDRYPNLYADVAARSQYLVHRDQQRLRDFMIDHQDKLLFATDRIAEKTAAYEAEFRYWETTTPTKTFYENVDATPGLGLPPQVLEKFYYKNALRAFCGQLPVPPTEKMGGASRTSMP